MREGALAVAVCGLSSFSALGQPVLFLRFNEHPAGTQATDPFSLVDASGRGHHGTPFGSPVYRAAQTPGGGTGLEFDGVGARVFVPDHEDFFLTGDFTVEAYIRVDGLPVGCCDNNQIVFRGDDDPGLDPFSLFLHTPSGRLCFAVDRLPNGRYTVYSPSAFPLGRLRHVAGTFDATTGVEAIYVDGIRVASANVIGQPIGALAGPGAGIGVGNVQSGTYRQFFRGLIDDVRVSSGVLPPCQFLPPVTACRAEINCDGAVDIFDFLTFQNLFALLDPRACDFDTSTGQGRCDIFDFLAFQNSFAAGCP